MRDEIKKFLEDNIGGDIVVDDFFDLKDLPLFLLEKYNFFKANFFGVNVMLLELLDDSLSTLQMKRNKYIVEEIFDVKVVFVLKNMSQFKRKKIIESGLSFILISGQMFLPFLGMKLEKALKDSKRPIDLFTPITQLVFLVFLYDKERVYNATELSKVLMTSQVHVIRALKDLYSIGLLKVSVGGKTGRSKYYRRIEDPYYYQIGRDFLISPVMKKMYIEDINILDSYVYSGLDGLSRISMINPSNNKTVAISKAIFRKISDKFYRNYDEIVEKELIEVEIWKYDPKILTSEEVVDVLSLKMSLNDKLDDRVEIEIGKAMEKEKWYTD